MQTSCRLSLLLRYYCYDLDKQGRMAVDDLLVVTGGYAQFSKCCHNCHIYSVPRSDHYQSMHCKILQSFLFGLGCNPMFALPAWRRLASFRDLIPLAFLKLTPSRFNAGLRD